MIGSALPKTRRLPRIAFAELHPFEQRVELLCRKHVVGPGELGKRAGLSHDTLPKMLRQTRDATPFPGSAETYVRLAEFYSVPIGWLLSRERIADGSPVPTDGATPPASSPPKTRT